MSDLSARRVVSVAVAMGILFAALSGGAVTYASFTDSGSVDVTVTTGDFTDTTDTESTEATGDESDDSITDESDDSDDTDDSTTNESENETTAEDSDDSITNESDDSDDTDDSTTNESENETTAEDSEYLSDGLSESGVSTTGEPRLTMIGDQNPEAGETVVDYRRLPANGL